MKKSRDSKIQFLEILAERPINIGVLEPELNNRFHVFQFVSGIIVGCIVDFANQNIALKRESSNGINQPHLPALSGFLIRKQRKDVRREHITTVRGNLGRGVFRIRLLNDPFEF